ncbi:mycothiol transferase [Arthrobacter sp.]|uniref:mycothiol transferase n=1 Tax=Arthrobacter sp. TaxID=1667 RepID=UPI003A8CCF50
MSSPAALALLTDGFGRVAETVTTLVTGASSRVLSYRPDEASNSVAWLVWHLSRVQDDHLADLAAVLAGRADPAEAGEHRIPAGQLWQQGGWATRFGLPYGPHDTGYGHASGDVAAFSATDGELLAGYHAAVHGATLEIVGSLTEPDFTRVVDRRWQPEVTAASRLVSVLNDTTQHAGQAAYVAGLAERSHG